MSYPNVETITGGPATIFTNQTAVISVNVALDGTPLAGAPVHWKASSGGLIIATPLPANSSSSTTTSTTSVTSTSAKSTRSTTTVAPAGAPAVNDTTNKNGSSVAVFHPDQDRVGADNGCGRSWRPSYEDAQLHGPSQCSSGISNRHEGEGQLDSRAHDLPNAPAPGRRSRRRGRSGLLDQEEEGCRRRQRRRGIRHFLRVISASAKPFTVLLL